MAYDFTGISAITIPEGNVKKITDSAGNVLWQKLIVIENEPSQKGTLTYTGSELSPEWYYYDETMMTCTGGNVRTNAGTYFAVFKPNDGYCWSDGSVDPKTIRWTIKKAAGSLSISPTSVTLNSSNTSKTITVTRAGDGAISAVSSDTSVATVTVNDDGTVTVNSVNGTSGNATITISVAAGTNHNAPADATVAVEAAFAVTVYIVDDDSMDLCSVSILDTAYFESTTIQVPIGTIAFARAEGSTMGSKIIHQTSDGFYDLVVNWGPGMTGVSSIYEFTITEDIVVLLRLITGAAEIRFITTDAYENTFGPLPS